MKRPENDSIMYLLGLLLAVGLIVLITIRGIFVDESKAKNALETQGYTNVQITDHAYFAMGLRGGDSSDAARFTARATNPAGKEVEIYVFVGWPFKGATIRSK